VREAAVHLVEREGLRGFANSVRLDEALDVLLDREGIRLTHGSIYGRIWDDQRDFQLDVVATAVSRYRGDDVAADIRATAELAGSAPAPGLIGPVFASAVASARRSRRWNLWIGASAAVVSTPDTEDDERLGAALAQARVRVTGTIGEALAEALGPAPSATYADLFVSLVIGASITTEMTAPIEVLTAALAGPPGHQG
jgi:hypothetical protein